MFPSSRICTEADERESNVKQLFIFSIKEVKLFEPLTEVPPICVLIKFEFKYSNEKVVVVKRSELKYRLEPVHIKCLTSE